MVKHTQLFVIYEWVIERVHPVGMRMHITRMSSNACGPISTTATSKTRMWSEIKSEVAPLDVSVNLHSRRR